MVAPLSADVLSELDRAQGGPIQVEDPRNHARYVVIPQQTYQRVQPLIDPAPPTNGDEPVEWNDAKNDRRCDLIDKEIDGRLTLEEAIELNRLQHEMYEYRHRVAPLPLDDARQLHRELLHKAAIAEGKAG